ncbi:hypothetical protein QYF61_019534 [Mycteria americana]|uniref:Uncharacterized protein n=1 Tax=Mycteria americana TaxID=33587 RepID=A0AAN7NL99_MYCAM|nr:hypothetical protein QYF61_019534 [Mycteria americana]
MGTKLKQTPAEHVKIFIYCERSCGVSITEDIQNTAAHRGKQQKHKGQQAQVPTRKIPTRYKKIIFSMWVVKRWNRLPREAVKSPSLEIVNVLLDKALAAGLSKRLDK